MTTQKQHISYFDQFKQFCTSTQSELSWENCKNWDETYNQSQIAKSFGSDDDLKMAGLEYRYRLWITHYSQIERTVAAGPVTLASVRKSSGGMKLIEQMSPIEKESVKNKIERHLESTVKRAEYLGSTSDKMWDIIVEKEDAAGLDLQAMSLKLGQAYQRLLTKKATVPAQQAVTNSQQVQA